LGRYFKDHSERIRSIKEDPDEAKEFEAMFVEEGAGREYFARFMGRDPDALMKQAEAALERAGELAGLLGQDRLARKAGAKLRDDARAELNEIRNLDVGKPVPEIAGVDLDGKTFRLSDYRDKVVVLDFWATWCGSYRVMFPRYRALLERVRGKPFVLLSVNGDGDKERVRELMKKELATWRTWFDGGGSANTTGPIAHQFNVRGWPTVYLIDHRGIIRHRFLSTPTARRMDTLIDTLVEEAEKAASGSKPL
jgi:thiol-disulfide isomerase/thioredoxin